MSRRRASKNKKLIPDPVYKNPLVCLFINNIMKEGKKSLASKMMYQAMGQIQEKTRQDPVALLEKVVNYVKPDVLVKARRVGGSTHQTPVKISKRQSEAFAIRWILASCRKRGGKNMVSNLTAELLEASNKKGNAIRKREEMDRMAEANKVYQRD